MVRTFDVNRVGGGTFEYVKNPETGNYEIREVGFEKIKSISLPDITAPEKTESAKDIVEKTTKEQTTTAFNIQQPKPEGDGRGVDLTGQMVKQPDLAKEAAKIDPQIDPQDVYGRPTMRQVAGESEFTRPGMRDVAGELQIPDRNRGQISESVKKPVGPGIRTGKTTIGSPFKAFGATPKSGIISRPERSFTRPAGIDAPMQSPEISSARPSGIDTQAPYTDAIMRGVKGAQAPQTELRKVSTGLKSLAKTVGAVLSSGPITSIANAMSGGPAQRDENKFNRNYFNAREDGRIAGNPAKDVFAGMNRESAFGNVELAAGKRIAKRKETAAKKNVSQEFKDNTKEMENQLQDYKSSQKGQALHGDGGGGGGGGRVICTELNKTDELSTLDWVRDIRFTYSKLSKKHIKGYLVWAVPTVRHIKKYPTYRKVWKHIAQHRANDIAWRTKKGNFDLLGRIYAGIGEPLCWLIGNFVSDKQFDELHAKGKRAI